MSIHIWNKKYTENLAETLERFRKEHREHKDSKITYAGRLDPMAEGLMILLTDADVHKKEEFLKLDKVYEVDFVLGMSTDTYDLLGLVSSGAHAEISEQVIKDHISQLSETTSQLYPPFSSKTVDGKPLWQWAREGTLNEIIIPRNIISIMSAEYINVKTISKDELHKKIIEAINQVNGDFRQREISDAWNDYFSKIDIDIYSIYSMRIHASSGTYMRTLVDTLGRELGTGATTLRINRLQVGKYAL